MNNDEQIYVALRNEGVDVWRPVQAEHLEGNRYRILSQPYDRDLESWQFDPGEEVLCEFVDGANGRFLAATKKAPRSTNR